MTWPLLLVALYALGAAAVLYARLTAPRQPATPTPRPRRERPVFDGYVRALGALYGHVVEREPLVLVFTRTEGWAA